MADGIRATVAFDDPDVCPVASLAAAADTTIETVRQSVAPADVPTVTEFRIEAGAFPDEREDADLAGSIEHVISLGATDVYRLEHGDGADCPCARLGRAGCPVDRYAATAGELELTFHAREFDQLQTVVADLREGFPSLDVKRLIRSPMGEAAADGVFVERGRLTDRQLEVLRAAYEAGYFDRPRRANATDVADTLGISRATFSEHLSIVFRKLFEDVLDERR